MFKKKIRKGCGIIAGFLAIVGFFQFTACYRTESGKKSDIVGTYKLVRRTYGQDSSGQAIDLIERDGIVEYLVFGEDGKGFRVYGDKNEELSCSEMRVTFEEDSENPGLYNFITYKVDPAVDGRRLGYYASEKMLNFGTPSLSSGCIKLEQSSTAYKKVSDDCTLGFVSGETSKTFEYVPYEFVNLLSATALRDTMYGTDPETGEFQSIDNGYIYFVVQFNPKKGTADFYYSLKSDKQKVERKDVPFTFEYSEDDNYQSITVEAGEFKFRAFLTGSLSMLTEKDGRTYETATDGYPQDDLDAYFDERIAAFEQTETN